MQRDLNVNDEEGQAPNENGSVPNLAPNDDLRAALTMMANSMAT